MRGSAIGAYRSNWSGHGLTVEAFDDITLHHPEDVVTMTGRPYQVFTAFKRAWLMLPKPSSDDATRDS